MFVIKFNDKYYWYGYNKVGKELRKAIIYKNKKIAREVLEDCLSRYEVITGWEIPNEELDTFKVVEVELREKEV